MDLTAFLPLIDAITNLLSNVDGKWASILVLVFLLLRAGVIRFPSIKIPFLKPKAPAAPSDPASPVGPDPDAPVPSPLQDLGEKLKEWLAERLKSKFGELLAKGHSHDEAFSHLASAIKTDPKLPLAEEAK